MSATSSTHWALGMYKEAFIKYGITGHALHCTESADDLKEVGVAIAISRRSLFLKIQEFKQSGVPLNLVE